MPAVKKLHQSSTNDSKPEFIDGHSLQALSLLASTEDGHRRASEMRRRDTEPRPTSLGRMVQLFLQVFAVAPGGSVELPRFRGHLNVLGAGHDAEEQTSKPPYSPELRRLALVASGRSPESLAEEYEPSSEAIRNWVRQAERDAGQREDGLTTAEKEELRELRREVRSLREERPILARAAGWFVRETGKIPPVSSSS